MFEFIGVFDIFEFIILFEFIVDEFIVDEFIGDEFIVDEFIVDEFIGDEFIVDEFIVDEFIVDEFIVDEFIVEFIILLELTLVLFAASVQAIPNIPKTNTPERAIIFFILFKVSCLLQRLLIIYLNCEIHSFVQTYLILEHWTI